MYQNAIQSIQSKRQWVLDESLFSISKDVSSITIRTEPLQFATDTAASSVVHEMDYVLRGG